MADSDFRIVVKAEELATHSFRLTSNSNRYPKKYRHSLCDKIQIKSLEIYESLFEANRINNKTDKNEAIIATDSIGGTKSNLWKKVRVKNAMFAKSITVKLG